MNEGSLNNLNSIVYESDKSEMMCISFSTMRSLFFVGHKSGIITAYSPDASKILKFVGLLKIHDASINRIFFKDLNAMQQFVMTCSSDFTLKIFKSDDSFENIATKTFDAVRTLLK